MLEALSRSSCNQWISHTAWQQRFAYNIFESILGNMQTEMQLVIFYLEGKKHQMSQSFTKQGTKRQSVAPKATNGVKGSPLSSDEYEPEIVAIDPTPNQNKKDQVVDEKPTEFLALSVANAACMLLNEDKTEKYTINELLSKCAEMCADDDVKWVKDSDWEALDDYYNDVIKGYEFNADSNEPDTINAFKDALHEQVMETIANAAYIQDYDDKEDSLEPVYACLVHYGDAKETTKIDQFSREKLKLMVGRVVCMARIKPGVECTPKWTKQELMDELIKANWIHYTGYPLKHYKYIKNSVDVTKIDKLQLVFCTRVFNETIKKVVVKYIPLVSSKEVLELSDEEIKNVNGNHKETFLRYVVACADTIKTSQDIDKRNIETLNKPRISDRVKLIRRARNQK